VTLSEIYNGIINDIETEFGGTIPAFGKVWARVLAAVQAGLLYIGYAWNAFILKNTFIDLADPEAQGGTLERWGRIKLGRDPYPAKQGQYTCGVTGAAGGIIPANTTFKSDSTTANPGKMFVIDNDYTMPGSTGVILLRALEAGTGSKLSVGDTLTCTKPIDRVNQTATVSLVTVTPLAAESIEDYRKKGELAFRLEPQGGAATDFRLWGLDVQAVANIYPYVYVATEVTVYVEAFPEDSLDGQGTPTTDTLNAVEAAIQLDPDTSLDFYQRGRRPMGVWAVNVVAIVVKQVEVIITGLTNSTTENRSNITSAIQAFMAETRPSIDGIDAYGTVNNVIDIPRISRVIIDASPISTFTSVALRIDGATLTTYTFDNGRIPYLTSISFL
jgi:uncharacterized phage protein gp47/JayE